MDPGRRVAPKKIGPHDLPHVQAGSGEFEGSKSLGTAFDLAQTLAKGLVQRPCIKLIPARKRFDLVVWAITRHTPAELLRMDEFDNPRKK